jgi:hypothetical protein
VMRRKWLGLVQPDDAANRQLPMLTPSSHVLYLVFSILLPRSWVSPFIALTTP